MDLSQLETLKEKLLQAKQFSSIFEYFMDHFGEDPKFMALGEAARHDLLEQIITQVSGQLFGEGVHVISHTLVRLADQQFIHGSFTTQGRLGTIIYFEDVQVGALALTMGPPSHMVQYIRFTGHQLPMN